MSRGVPTLVVLDENLAYTSHWDEDANGWRVALYESDAKPTREGVFPDYGDAIDTVRLWAAMARPTYKPGAS